MPQQREMATDRLVSVIQAIQMGRWTGKLMVRRGKGAVAEEGEIVFVKGQFTDAHVGRHKGSEAFNILSTWGQSFFLFTSTGPNEQPAFFPGLPSPASANPTSESGIAANVSPLRRTTDPLPPLLAPSRPELQYSAMTIPHPLIIQIHQALHTLETLKLSRAHRQILLLVDGQRSILELSRLTGRSQEEIYRILQDLERASILRLMTV